jgi:hypothetical protein
MSNARAKRLIVLIPWFGQWPDWMRFFLASCRANPTVDWVLIGDASEREDFPPNVRRLAISLEDYRALVSRKLGIRCLWNEAYKVCDLRPAYGVIHNDLISGYDYWGYGDLDVVYGDIRAIYTDEVLTHDLVSPHAHVVAGHFTLYRNSSRMNEAFRRIFGWRRMLASAEHRSFDEQVFTRLFPRVSGFSCRGLLDRPLGANALFVERHSTNIPPLAWIDGGSRYPEEWYWRAGRLTNDRAGDRDFLYLHFSNWQSNRWTSETVAPWKTLLTVDRIPGDDLAEFRISREGFTPIVTAKRIAA